MHECLLSLERVTSRFGSHNNVVYWCSTDGIGRALCWFTTSDCVGDKIIVFTAVTTYTVFCVGVGWFLCRYQYFMPRVPRCACGRPIAPRLCSCGRQLTVLG